MTNYNLTIAIYNNKLKISNKINKQTKYYKNKYLIKRLITIIIIRMLLLLMNNSFKFRVKKSMNKIIDYWN
jgi:hypothetical protein